MRTQSHKEIVEEYSASRGSYEGCLDYVENTVESIIKSQSINVHEIIGRVKTVESLEGKVKRKNYSNLAEITDLCGIRIITYFSDDVDKIAELISQEFEVDVENTIDKRKSEDPTKFGYVSLHYVVGLKEGTTPSTLYGRFKNIKLEIQIRTVMQHAWAEIEHDLGYKSKEDIPDQYRRQFSRLAGLIELADDNFLQLKNSIDPNSWFGISGIHKERAEVEKAYRECIYAINNRILINENLFFWKEELEITELLEKDTLEIFSRFIEFGRIREAEKIIDKLFAKCIREHANIYSLYNAIIQLFSVLRKNYYNGCQVPSGEGGYFLFDFKIDLYQFHTADELKEHLLMILKEVCEKSEENENELLIENILSYLENHYADDITLNELAEHKYFVSVGHLSRTFKNKTGLTFSKYLTELRLKKAIEFLKNTDFDITDIATFTGYNDASYFTQIFRKSCGMTPSEYRILERKKAKQNSDI